MPGVFVLSGLGARGFTLAPLLGECVASEICGEPSLLSKGARAAIHPERFLKRALRRRS
jgi:tRNA 5-methylaminomethyl-2-thiouridine biosynthesis bifunctional protein